MYDAALETLRSTDLPIEPEMIGPRAIRTVERSLDSALSFVGSLSVIALELALEDKRYRDHLHQRASELGTAVPLDQWSGPCDYCTFEEKDAQGNTIKVICGTKEACEAFGLLFIILLIVLVLKALWDWLT